MSWGRFRDLGQGLLEWWKEERKGCKVRTIMSDAIVSACVRCPYGEAGDACQGNNTCDTKNGFLEGFHVCAKCADGHALVTHVR